MTTLATPPHIEERIALYRARADAGLDIFTGRPPSPRLHALTDEPVPPGQDDLDDLERDDVRRPAPPIARGIIHARCGADLWRHYGRNGWKCVPCSCTRMRQKRARSG